MNWVRIKSWVGTRRWDWLVDLAYHDQARLSEWLSVAFLSNFYFEFMFNSDLAARDTYAGFAAIGFSAWAGFTGGAALFQIMTIIWRGPSRDDLRFAAMTISCAFWCAVAFAFWSSGIQTTANWAYTAVAFHTFFAAGFLLWKSTAKG